MGAKRGEDMQQRSTGQTQILVAAKNFNLLYTGLVIAYGTYSFNDHLCMEATLFLNGSNDVFGDIRFCNESAHVSSITAATTSYLLCTFVGSLSVLTMCGNLLVIMSISYFKQLQTPTNYLILSLAVADLLVGIFILPYSTILSVSSCFNLQDVLCQLRGSSDMFLCTSSILNLCFISVDRYYAVCQPLRYKTKINVRVIVIMILVSWTVSALVGIGITIRGLKQEQSNGRCILFQNTSFVIPGTVFAFYLPALIMFTIYLKVFMVAQRQARSIQNRTCQGTKSGATVSKMERKATKTLAIVMGIFLICWTPFFLCITFNPLSNGAIPLPLIEIFKWLGWSNSMLNPLIYAFFYSWFRLALRMMLSGKIFQGDFTNSKLF
uniref:trace amine-associated receptor 1-like n=1 Tax=Scatophagus argus TaxID=75038 RepID=UPI001ED80686|nr:trace amine-associated receptor 1-like [Scatophagus argus]